MIKDMKILIRNYLIENKINFNDNLESFNILKLNKLLNNKINTLSGGRLQNCYVG